MEIRGNPYPGFPCQQPHEYTFAERHDAERAKNILRHCDVMDDITRTEAASNIFLSGRLPQSETFSLTAATSIQYPTPS